MEPEVLLQMIDKLRIKYRGQKFDIEEGSPYIEESCKLIEKFRKELLIDFAGWNDEYGDAAYKAVDEYLNEQ